jgi:ComF family protein
MAPSSREAFRSQTRVAEAAAALRAVGARALDILYPPACLACRKATAAHHALCPDCWGQMGFIERPYCERLGTPFVQDLRTPGLISPEAMAEPPVFGRARAVVRYDDGPARRLVHRLKYSDRLELARPMGVWMARAGAELLGEADLIVPVPLHRLRLISRRFNQAATLAHCVAEECAVPVDTQSLARAKQTPPLVGLSRPQRAGNVQGAFRVPEEAKSKIYGTRIVLIDDVLTSGATANAASRALLRGGAKSVDVLVFARVVTSA